VTAAERLRRATEQWAPDGDVIVPVAALRELLAEHDFVLARSEAERNHVYPRCWGISSNALAVYALGRGPHPDRVCDFPYDEDDLAACERTYEMAPPHLRERMTPVLEQYRAWVRRNRRGQVAR
jgi:hypothetical protein